MGVGPIKLSLALLVHTAPNNMILKPSNCLPCLVGVEGEKMEHALGLSIKGVSQNLVFGKPLGCSVGGVVDIQFQIFPFFRIAN